MSVAIKTVKAVDTVYLYYVGQTGLLKRLEPEVETSTATIVSRDILKKFQKVQFVAISNGEESRIYYLEENTLRHESDPYSGMVGGG